MKEASGELNMTIVTIIAIAGVLAFVVMFLPKIFESVGEKWNNTKEQNITVDNNIGG